MSAPSLPSPPPGAAPPPGLAPEAFERVAWVLRIGLVASVALLAGGTAAYLLAHPHATFEETLATNPAGGYLSFSTLATGLGQGRPEAVVALGVVVLLATPPVRILTGMYYFARGRERALALIALAVFAMVLVGLFVVGPSVR